MAIDLPPYLPQVIFINDLEADKQYRRWEFSVTELMRVYPGMLPRVRRNLFNCFYIIDPGTAEGLRYTQKIWHIFNT